MLDLLKQENPVYCGGLIDIIKESILNRFEKYNLYDTRAKDSILAAVSYPFFKLKWVPRTEKDSSTTSTDGNSSTCTDLETL
ncbi:hypothetical protein EVAR_11480_1 [Eumeta japonica]|uniref:Uncharacterized protein n=1 Tax=Eumeta variegata TaxID=151549 RepID=A0A4C1TYM2_EUMVA|nr:hypothetical protein EVAR_11480_1 [Eumeta japonica]